MVRTFYQSFTASILFLLAVSCATSNIDKARLADGTTPEEAIRDASRLKERARATQADVLSYKDYTHGEKYLKKAKESLKDSEKDEALEKAAYSQAFFQRAMKEIEKDEKEYKNILEARAQAVTAGAFTYSGAKKEITKVDADLRSDTAGFRDSLSAEKTADFQNKYLGIEVLAVQERELGKAEDVLFSLRDKNAEDLAPKTYKKAKEDILLSKNIIEKSPRDAGVYKESVTEALKSTIMLQDVMAVIEKNGPKTPESAAIQIVKQSRKIGEVEQSIAALGSTVLSQADQLAFQRAMDNVRSEFSEDEAEVYQQGDKLLIRLKKMNFPVGGANIPENSKSILTKINTIVRELDPSQVEIQGHTDSTGSAQINEKLSDMRAQNVARFLKQHGLTAKVAAEGYGPKKPLADNQTKEGRAMNRRVDIVISAGEAERFSE